MRSATGSFGRRRRPVSGPGPGDEVAERDTRGQRQPDGQREGHRDQAVRDALDGQLVEAPVGGQPRQQRDDPGQRDHERRDVPRPPRRDSPAARPTTVAATPVAITGPKLGELRERRRRRPSRRHRRARRPAATAAARSRRARRSGRRAGPPTTPRSEPPGVGGSFRGDVERDPEPQTELQPEHDAGEQPRGQQPDLDEATRRGDVVAGDRVLDGADHGQAGEQDGDAGRDDQRRLRALRQHPRAEQRRPCDRGERAAHDLQEERRQPPPGQAADRAGR